MNFLGFVYFNIIIYDKNYNKHCKNYGRLIVWSYVLNILYLL